MEKKLNLRVDVDMVVVCENDIVVLAAVLIVRPVVVPAVGELQ